MSIWKNIMALARRTPPQQEADRTLRSMLLLYPKLPKTIDVADWVAAVKKADHLDNPSRFELMRIFTSVMDDAHLSSVANTRRQQVLKAEWVVMNGDEVDEAATALIQRRWFYDLTSYVHDAELWGYSLMEFGDLQAREFRDLYLIPREYVVPDRGYILTRGINTGGRVPYMTEDFPLLLAAGDPASYGLLNKAVPLVLYKRFTLAAWTEHAERYGQPLMVGRTNAKDQASIDRLARMIEDLGSSGGGVLDLGEEIQFVESNKQVAHVLYEALVDKIDAQISKLIGGQTMTSDDGSSLSQAQVHLAISDDYTRSDLRRVRFWLNDHLVPFLAANGYPFAGRRFAIKEQDRISLPDRWTIVREALQHFHIEPAWIEETFGVPVEAKAIPAVTAPAPQPDPAMRNRYRSLPAKLGNWYKGAQRGPVNVDGLGELAEGLIAAIWGGTYAAGTVPVTIWEAVTNHLQDLIEEGYGEELEGVDIRDRLKQDARRFSAYKSWHLAQELAAQAAAAAAEEEFMAQARRIAGRHLGGWLAAESQAAQLSAIGARQWAEFQQTASTLPHLRYETAGDDRVRPDHDRLDGVVLPINHPFWDTHCPPIDFGCRCDMQATSTRDAVTPNPPSVPVHPAFAQNPGKTGRIFSGSHPYYDVSAAERIQIDAQL